MQTSPYISSKKIRLLLLGLGGLLALFQFGPAYSNWPENPQESTSPKINQNVSSINFSWNLGSKQLEKQTDGTSTAFLIQDFIQSNSPGEYVLPEQSHLIVLPNMANPSLEITGRTQTAVHLSVPLAISPIPSGTERADDGTVINGAYITAERAKSPVPTSPIHLEEIGQMAGVRLARLTFSPIIYDQKTKRHQFVSALDVQVTYGVDVDARSNRSSFGSLTRLEDILAQQVVNPELLYEADSKNRQAQAISPPNHDLILEIDQFGLHEITYNDLAAVDSNIISTNPALWQLGKKGESVAMHWIGDADTKFEAGERFLFYAAPDANRWSKREFYTLTAGSALGSRMNQAPSNPTALPTGQLTVSKTFEQDSNYTPNCYCGHLPTGRDGDRWIWDELRLPGNPTGNYQADLPEADISSIDSAELTLWMIGFTNLPKDDDHMLDLSMNNIPLDDVVWDGKTAITRTVSIPAGVLSTVNELELTIDGSENPIDGIWLDAFSISYTKSSTNGSAVESFLYTGQSSAHQYNLNLGQAGWAFDVTNKVQPQFIGSNSSFVLKDQGDSEHIYLVTSETDVKQPALRKSSEFSNPTANLLLIGPTEFEAGIAPLVQLRTNQGWQVGFIPLDEIYDSYGFGYPSPFAIQAALQDLYESGSVRPEAVILVGDGTHDPKLNQANGKETFVPVMFADVDQWIGEIPADNRYVAVAGNDILPDMLLGRLPANNLAELETMVSKLTAYPSQNLGWRKNITFVADNNDNAGQFSEFVTSQSSLLDNEVYQISSVQFSGSEPDLPQVKSQIGTQFSTGSNHLIYVGHSTVHQWADESLMHISQVEGLSNSSRLPIILQMTCFTGSFHMAGLDSFDEALLRHETGGAIGVWGATGLSVTTGHESLAKGYLEILDSAVNPLVGEAILAGKIKMMTEKPSHADLVDTYTFFGDPTLILTAPGDGEVGGDGIFLPLVNKK